MLTVNKLSDKKSTTKIDATNSKKGNYDLIVLKCFSIVLYLLFEIFVFNIFYLIYACKTNISNI